MTNIRRFTFTDPTIVSSVENSNDNTLWIAHAQNGSGNCLIKKVVGTSPNQTYFTVTRAVSGINDLKLTSSYLYVAYNDLTKFAERMSLTNPLTTFTSVNYPSGVVESPVACTIQGSNIWLLTPGLSGNYAKLIRYNTSMVWQQTKILNDIGFEVTDAIDITVDSNGELQVITNTDPSTFVRVYDTGGNNYAYQITATP